MDEQDERQVITRRRSGRVWTGLFLLLIGGVLLLDQMNFPLPDWLFNWHILLIAIGLFIGLRHSFRGGSWIILLVIGGVLLVQDYYPEYHLHRFLWPGILIVVGLLIIARPHRRGFRGQFGHEWRQEWEKNRMNWRYHASTHPPGGFHQGSTPPAGGTREEYSSADFIDATSIFGGVHKKVMSKNFKGGDITTFMGGTEIDLSQADFTGTVRLDVTQIMGGTKIIVPAHWEVRSEVTAIFAGFEDKRQQPAVSNPDKVLIIDGTSIFGGIELKNF